ncbi:MAG: hypothetical protein ACE5E6_12780 [Phycisphaerae bacterium]
MRTVRFVKGGVVGGTCGLPVAYVRHGGRTLQKGGSGIRGWGLAMGCGRDLVRVRTRPGAGFGRDLVRGSDATRCGVRTRAGVLGKVQKPVACGGVAVLW